MTPDEPTIVEKNEEQGQIFIKIHEGASDNGPISGYRIVVICGLAEFDQDLLDSYYNAESKGLSYYISAELGPDVSYQFGSIYVCTKADGLGI